MSSLTEMYIFETPEDVKGDLAYVLPMSTAVPKVVDSDGTVVNRFGNLPVLSPRFARRTLAPQPARVRGAMNVAHGKLAGVRIAHDGEIYNGVRSTEDPAVWTFPALAMAYRFTTDGPDATNPGSLRCRPIVAAVRTNDRTGSGAPAGKVKIGSTDQAPAPAPSAKRRVTNI